MQPLWNPAYRKTLCSAQSSSYACHINDLPTSAKSEVRLFADDCLLYGEINNSFADHVALQNDLHQLEQWASDWGMHFNAQKCYILSIQSTFTFAYSLNNTFLKEVPNTPYLGIQFSANLNWQTYISKPQSEPVPP